jgi:hypothetical protein
MEYIKRYFDTVEEANVFIQQINNVLGIPVSQTATTRTYTEYQTDEDGIYIEYEEFLDESLN